MQPAQCDIENRIWHGLLLLFSRGGGGGGGGNNGTDQTARMRTLVCAFVVRMQQNQFFWTRGPYNVM